MKKVKLFDLANNDQVLFVATTDDDGNPCIEQIFFHNRDEELLIQMKMVLSFKEGEHDKRDSAFINNADYAQAVKFSQMMLNVLPPNNG